MPLVCWQVDDRRARLELPPLSGWLDMECLAAGITGLSIGGWRLEHPPRAGNIPAQGTSSVPQVGLLGLELPGEAGRAPLPAEWYTRQYELVAWFTAGGERPVEVHTIWRGVPGGAEEAFAAAVDLIIGVRTHCLEANPELSVVSWLPASDVIPVGLAEGAAVGPWAWSKEGSPAAAYLFRMGGGWSYAEMLHPATRGESRWRSMSHGMAEVRHCLFAEPAEKLEKGVLLRAWIRGALVPEDGDVRRVGCIYSALADSEPPLDA